jgi:hypothetical protein
MLRALPGGAERGPVISAAFLVSSLFVLTVTVVAGAPSLTVAAGVAAASLIAVAYRSLLTWKSLLTAMILVILFLPIKRYTLPGNLPFDLEPYRILVSVVIFGWLASLLIDPHVRVRATGLEAPILLVFFTAIVSDLVNPGRVSSVQSDVVKSLTFLLSYFLVFFLIASVVRKGDTLDFLIKVLVSGGAIVAFFALVEFRTGFNIFDKVAASFMTLSDDVAATSLRGGDLRVAASAQGPIPLGAALVLLLPASIYLAIRFRRKRWYLASALLVLGAFATVSRTSVVMLLVIGLVFLVLRPRETKRLWPFLVPAVLALHVAVPGTIGSLQSAFSPGSIIKTESAHPGWRGSGRIADLGPAMQEFGGHPLFGQGFGTRQPGRELNNAQILDDQWLKTLLETGIIGTFAWVWLLVRFARRTGRAAKADDSERGWLLTAITASVLAFSVGMFLYDTFSFIQVTFLFFIILGLGAAALANPAEGQSEA